MKTSSYWIESAPLPRFPKVEKDLTVDVVIVGAGITGLTAAHQLKRSGKRVAVIERDRCARGDTGYTTAHLTAVTDLSRQDLAKDFGREAARAVWDAGMAAIDHIVQNIRRGDIACDFRWITGYLHAPIDEAGAARLARERKWLEREARAANDAGIEARFMDAVPFFNLPGVAFPHQALFHPRKYLAALAASIPGGGSHVFEGCNADEIESKPLRVKTKGGTISADALVIGTHNPLVGVAGLLGATLFQTKLALYSSYALGARLAPGLIPEGAYWDTAEPYNYLRVESRRGFDYAIFGGEDHKTGQCADTTAPYRELEARLRSFAPKAEVEHRWSGQVIDTPDGLPYIGEMTKQQFGATGFAGNGMTFGTLAGMMAADWVMGRTNPWAKLFAPSRKKPVAGAWSYLAENKDYPYYLVRDWLARAEGQSLKALGKGQGKILNLEGRKVAAYRDEEGKVTLCSPVCTHLKCIVGWNEAEATWDCPCHGSRFRPTGEVISGPAEEPLERLKAEAR